MDRIGRMSCIQGKDFRSTTRWSKQNHFLLEPCQSLHDGSRKGGLPRSCTTTQDHHRLFLTIQHECREHVEGMFLFRRRHQSEGLQDTVFQLILNHNGCKDTKKATDFTDYRRFFITFAADMQISDKVINILLAIVAAGLLAVCIASVMSGIR